ncbi:ubiquitin-conjugating enzyme E2 4 [Drosophila innubila]|uniref:ubiquitin-conjugating enzyme E2 4 n=1 Tax=Drosophila innubila TaxID=198719 RepID=UPI00148D7070|nr:ubiquitin-conjugating enzyme E2 4 [Drosophila innubila]
MSSKSSIVVSPSKTKPIAEKAAEEEGNVATPPGDENEPSTSQGQVRNQAESGGSVSDSSKVAISQHQLNGPVMRIKRELSEITKNPPPNCSAEMHKEDLFHWKATVNGPSGSVYEGGIFKLDIRFPGAYPFRPPQIRFVTRIYHCNVDSRGVICLDVLNERWSPVMNIAKVLLSIWVLIGECNPHDPLVMGIAEQYKCNRKEHDKIARYWTKRFAMPKPKSKQEQEDEEKEEQSQEPSSSTENPN